MAIDRAAARAMSRMWLATSCGRSIDSIVMRLDNLSEQEVIELNLDTGLPLVYDMDENGNVLGKTVMT